MPRLRPVPGGGALLLESLMDQAEYHRRWVAGHRVEYREKQRLYLARWRAAHGGSGEYQRKWRADHPMAARMSFHNAHAKRRGAQSCEHLSCLAIGAAQLAWITNPHVCWMCGIPIQWGVNLHMDHVVPISRGGLHCSENLRPACPGCNLHKGSSQPGQAKAATLTAAADAVR